MIKYFICAVISGLLIATSACNTGTGSGSAGDTIKPSPGNSSAYTSIKWKDSVIDLGTLTMGDKKKVAFTCVNTGSKNLFIYQARPSCGCTVADYTKTPIAPGKEGTVTAEFDTNKSHPGSARKSIFVETNTRPSDNGSYLIFTANIVADSSKDASAKHS